MPQLPIKNAGRSNLFCLQFSDRITMQAEQRLSRKDDHGSSTKFVSSIKTDLWSFDSFRGNKVKIPPKRTIHSNESFLVTIWQFSDW